MNIINISEGRESRSFGGIKKLITNVEGGGTQTWVRESDSDLIEKVISENGVYEAETEVVKDEKTGEQKEISGYSKVTVNIPLGAKVITANGVYNAADDKNAEGKPLAGYSSIEVAISSADTPKPDDPTNPDDPTKPDTPSTGDTQMGAQIINLPMKVRARWSGKKKLPIHIRIRNTKTGEYGSYEKSHTPTVDFSKAKCKLTGGFPFSYGFRVGAIGVKFGTKIKTKSKTVTMKTAKDENTYGGWGAFLVGSKQSGHIDRWVINDSNGKAGRICASKMEKAGDGFNIILWAPTAAMLGPVIEVSNVKFEKDEYFSFVLEISV